MGNCDMRLASIQAPKRGGRDRRLAGQRPSARLAAFTLIEVLITVVIIGIAAAIVVPKIAELGTFSVQGAARLVVADLLYAQNEAVARQEKIAVVFDPAHNVYRLLDVNGPDDEAGTGDDNAILEAPMRGGLYVVNFSTDSRFNGIELSDADFAATDPPRVIFNALGAPSCGGYVELDIGQTQYRIRVTPFTGRVTVRRVAK